MGLNPWRDQPIGLQGTVSHRLGLDVWYSSPLSAAPPSNEEIDSFRFIISCYLNTIQRPLENSQINERHGWEFLTLPWYLSRSTFVSTSEWLLSNPRPCEHGRQTFKQRVSRPLARLEKSRLKSTLITCPTKCYCISQNMSSKACVPSTHRTKHHTLNWILEPLWNLQSILSRKPPTNKTFSEKKKQKRLQNYPGLWFWPRIWFEKKKNIVIYCFGNVTK